jgi:hypothetical protein
MLLGLDVTIWKIMLVLMLVPTLSVAALNVIFRKRGGIGVGWGGVIFVLLAGIVALVIVLARLRP